VPFVAGERYSAADITALVTVDFAKALQLSITGRARRPQALVRNRLQPSQRGGLILSEQAMPRF